MSNKFGILSKLTFLQDLASVFIARVNPAVTHNLEKYAAIKKIMFLTVIEEISGDYLEFGVYKGGSLCHAMRSYRALSHLSQTTSEARFYGFDSFEGFGILDEYDVHPFFLKENFRTSFEAVAQRAQKVARNKLKFVLIPGLFEKSLLNRPEHYGLNKARIIFIDCDTFKSSSLAFEFSKTIIQVGTFFILDDYFAYHGRNDRGVAAAFNDFVFKNNIKTRRVFDYGMGGVVYVVSGLDS